MELNVARGFTTRVRRAPWWHHRQTDEQRTADRENMGPWGCTLLPVPWTSRRADAFLARGEGVIRRWGSVGEFFHL